MGTRPSQYGSGPGWLSHAAKQIAKGLDGLLWGPVRPSQHSQPVGTGG